MLITTSDAAVELAAQVLNKARSRCLIALCVTDGADGASTLAALQAALAGRADLVTVMTGAATWELKRRLPAGLDVYGSAVRLWYPGAHAGHAERHPLILVDEATTTAALAARVAELVAATDALEQPAVVEQVAHNRAVLRLANGESVVVPRDEATTSGLPLDRMLRVAQTVRTFRLTDAGPDGPAEVTLLPFEVDPRSRVVEGHPREPVLGRVSEVRSTSAVVELLPGVHGVARVGQLADHWVSHPSDIVRVGDIVAVRILAATAHRIDLAMRGIAEPSTVRALSMLPDGPGWLDPHALATELPAAPEHRNTWIDDAHDDQDRPILRPPDETFLVATDFDAIQALVRNTRAVAQQAERLTVQAAARMNRLRTELLGLRRQVETDLVELRDRVLRSVELDHAQIEGSSRDLLRQARADVDDLRQQLAAAMERCEALDRRADKEEVKQRRLRAELTAAHDKARTEQRAARRLARELDTLASAAARARAAIRQCWLDRTTPADRERFPWREPLLGPEFLDSVELLEGISASRVFEVCAEVASGRARVGGGLQVHALRAGTGNGSGQVVRADGARAFRASLQIRTAAARRLHFWELPDGRIELAKVGYHDDFTIR